MEESMKTDGKLLDFRHAMKGDEYLGIANVHQKCGFETKLLS